MVVRNFNIFKFDTNFPKFVSFVDIRNLFMVSKGSKGLRWHVQILLFAQVGRDNDIGVSVIRSFFPRIVHSSKLAIIDQFISWPQLSTGAACACNKIKKKKR